MLQKSEEEGCIEAPLFAGLQPLPSPKHRLSLRGCNSLSLKHRLHLAVPQESEEDELALLDGLDDISIASTEEDSDDDYQVYPHGLQLHSCNPIGNPYCSCKLTTTTRSVAAYSCNPYGFSLLQL